jgi:hypothetical protein
VLDEHAERGEDEGGQAHDEGRVAEANGRGATLFRRCGCSMILTALTAK